MEMGIFQLDNLSDNDFMKKINKMDRLKLGTYLMFVEADLRRMDAANRKSCEDFISGPHIENFTKNKPIDISYVAKNKLGMYLNMKMESILYLIQKSKKFDGINFQTINRFINLNYIQNKDKLTGDQLKFMSSFKFSVGDLILNKASLHFSQAKVDRMETFGDYMAFLYLDLSNQKVMDEVIMFLQSCGLN